MAQKSKDTYSGLRKAADIALQERNRYRSLYELLLKDYNALKEKYESMSEDIDQICEAKIQAAITPIIKERDEARSELLKAVDKNVNLQAQLNDLTKICDDLTRAVDNATIALQMTKIKKFITSSEQARILNNRGANRDKRGEEKDNFDGTPESVQSGEGGNNPPAEPGEGDTQQETQSGEAKEQPQKKKKSKGRRPALEPYVSVDVVRHPLSEYFELPEGGKFKTRGGEIEIHERIWYEYIPGRFVRHIYETATYEDAVGDCKNTLPEDALDTPVKGCPFGVEMLVFILVEKYAYHNSKNNIRRKLKEMGASFAKSTFVHYYQLAEKLLVDMFGSVFKGAVLEIRNFSEFVQIIVNIIFFSGL